MAISIYIYMNTCAGFSKPTNEEANNPLVMLLLAVAFSCSGISQQSVVVGAGSELW